MYSVYIFYYVNVFFIKVTYDLLCIKAKGGKLFVFFIIMPYKRIKPSERGRSFIVVITDKFVNEFLVPVVELSPSLAVVVLSS